MSEAKPHEVDAVAHEVAALDALLRAEFWKALQAPGKYHYSNDWESV